jgi:hypothetical protein
VYAAKKIDLFPPKMNEYPAVQPFIKRLHESERIAENWWVEEV